MRFVYSGSVYHSKNRKNHAFPETTTLLQAGAGSDSVDVL